MAQVVAKRRVKRKDDAYAALDAALWQLEHAPCEAERFTDFVAADALRYLADEMARSEDLAQKVPPVFECPHSQSNRDKCPE